MQQQGGIPQNISADWNQTEGRLVFAPAQDTVPGANYTIVFELQNNYCQQNAPTMNVNISGVCFQRKSIEPLPSTHCGVQTMPLQVLGGPCDGRSSSAIFTLKNISQSSPFPGCNNTITVDLMMSMPLSNADKASLALDFDSSLVIGLDTGDIRLAGESKDNFFGSLENQTASARWRRGGGGGGGGGRLTLNVARGMDLQPCQRYTVTFQVVNPIIVSLVPLSGPDRLLQEAQVVVISAAGSLGELIGNTIMTVNVRRLDLRETSFLDAAPMRVHAPRFFVKKIGQSSPV
jgi:hypothetical protein